jgi:hypothetical protein
VSQVCARPTTELRTLSRPLTHKPFRLRIGLAKAFRNGVGERRQVALDRKWNEAIDRPASVLSGRTAPLSDKAAARGGQSVWLSKEKDDAGDMSD